MQFYALVYGRYALACALACLAVACSNEANPNDAPGGVDTGVIVQTQETYTTCWAAATQAVEAYVGVDESQCAIITRVFGRECCDSDNHTLKSCAASYHMAIQAPVRNGFGMLEEIRSEFVKGSLPVLLYKGTGWAHLEVVTASECDGDDSLFTLQDPATYDNGHAWKQCVTYADLEHPTTFLSTDAVLTEVHYYLPLSKEH